MKELVYILIFLTTVATANTVSPSPEASPLASPEPTALDRLLSSVRGKLPSFITGAPVAVEASPSPVPSAGPTIVNPLSTTAVATPAPAVPAVPVPNPAPAVANAVANAVATPASASPPAPIAPTGGTNPTNPTNPDAEKAKVVMDDNAPQGQADGGTNDNGGQKHEGAPSKVKGAKGKPVAFSKWYPMCLFFDATVRNANAIVKALTDMAAKCKVNLVTWPVFIKNYSGNADSLKKDAKQRCNAPEGLEKKTGANRASAVVITGNDKLPLEMCDAQGESPKDIKYCAELGWKGNESLQGRMQPTGRWGGEADDKETAVAVVGSQGQTPEDVAAATGQSWLSLPPGSTSGNGTGDELEGYASAGAKPEPGWSDSGCQRMRDTAFDNSAGKWKYLEDRENYAVEPKNGRRFDMTSSKNLFAKPKEVPKAGQVATASAGDAGGTVGGAGDAGGTAGGVSGATAGASGTGAAPTRPSTGGGADVYASGAGHKQETTGAGVKGGPEIAPGRRELEDGSTVRNNLLVTEGATGGEGTTIGGATGRTRVEASEGDGTARVVYDDSTRRPASVGETRYGPGDSGAPTGVPGADLLSVGGASALQTQVNGELPAPAKPGTIDPENGNERRPRVVVEGVNGSSPRPVDTASPFDGALVKDDLKKMKVPGTSPIGVDFRKPRVIQ